MSELIKRIIVAIIGIPLAIAIVYVGGWYLAIVVMIITVLALKEFYNISAYKHSYPNTTLGYITGVLLIVNFQYYYLFQAMIYAVFLIIIFTLLTFILEMWHKKPNSTLNVSATITGVLYIPLSMSSLILIRNFYDITQNIQSHNYGFVYIPKNVLASTTEGAWLLMSIFVSIWICDSAAYFIGKAIGKHKLFERISPKKTWEGAISGLIFAVISFWGASEIMLKDFPDIYAIVIGLIVGVIGQIGDLSESMLKRDAQIKDSSDLLPGHGGVLDRFDSILFVIPIVFIYLFLAVAEF